MMRHILYTLLGLSVMGAFAGIWVLIYLLPMHIWFDLMIAFMIAAFLAMGWMLGYLIVKGEI